MNLIGLLFDLWWSATVISVLVVGLVAPPVVAVVVVLRGMRKWDL